MSTCCRGVLGMLSVRPGRTQPESKIQRCLKALGTIIEKVAITSEGHNVVACNSDNWRLKDLLVRLLEANAALWARRLRPAEQSIDVVLVRTRLAANTLSNKILPFLGEDANLIIDASEVIVAVTMNLLSMAPIAP